jgi:hypothetical protein
VSVSSRYGSLWCIDPAGDQVGYRNCPIPLAQELAQQQSWEHPAEVQALLLADFRADTAVVPQQRQAEAGLCLRCYLSAAILKACQRVDYLFGGDKAFTYRDLLPFVLNDDGKTLVVLDRDRKNQLALTAPAEPQAIAYPFFSVDILRTFQAQPSQGQASLSLDNWAMLRTKQQPDLKQFLAEFGFQHLSDWALLNRARAHQIQQLSERDRVLVAVFHGVYRRDRRQTATGQRCPDPSPAQLHEMLALLQDQHPVASGSPSELMTALKQVATQLRHYDIWAHRLPLEVPDGETGQDRIRSDLPAYGVNESELEQQEMLTFFQQQLEQALNQAISQELGDRIHTLQRSKAYAAFADQFIPGLRLYYEQALSLKEIAPRLGLSSWDQARRVLNPGDLLSKVRWRTVQQVCDRLLEQAQRQGYAATPPDPDYLRTLAEQVEAIADHDIFQAAVEEMRAGQGRSFTSLYAQRLRDHLASNERPTMSEKR